jgi:hypothetical protein
VLWPRDAEAARAVFAKAADGVRTLIAETDSLDPQLHNRRQTIMQLRQQLIEAAGRHDAKLALDFLRVTRQPPAYVYPNSDYKPTDQELRLEMTLASYMAAQDPQRALSLAESSLQRGFSSNMSMVLHTLATKDRDAAIKLATTIIGRLRAQTIASDYEASNLALALFGMTRTPAPHAENNRPNQTTTGNGFWSSENIPVDEATRRRLIEMLVTAGLMNVTPQTVGLRQNILGALRESQAEIERYAPSQAAAFARRTTEVMNSNELRRGMSTEERLLAQNGSIEALLEAAVKAAPETRDQLYTSAAWKATGENDFERARQIAGNVVNPEQRSQLLRQIGQQQRWRGASQGNVNETRDLISNAGSLAEKASVLMQLSGQALGRGDKVAAREFLEEARTLLGRGENSNEFYTLFSLARQYAQTDEGASFEILERMVARLNELLEAAVVVDGFGQEAFKDGELRIHGGMWNDMITRFAGELAQLARKDFERARGIAKTFQRRDARTTAELMLARDILQAIPTEGQPVQQSRRVGRQ